MKKLELRVDTRIFDLEILKATVHRYCGDFSIEISQSELDFICNIKSQKDLSADDWASFERDFRRELIDNDLRRKIRDETEGYRNLILAVAFSKTGLQSNE